MGFLWVACLRLVDFLVYLPSHLIWVFVSHSDCKLSVRISWVMTLKVKDHMFHIVLLISLPMYYLFVVRIVIHSLQKDGLLFSFLKCLCLCTVCSSIHWDLIFVLNHSLLLCRLLKLDILLIMLLGCCCWIYDSWF